MKTRKQSETRHCSFTLRLKIISGYVLLLILLGIIVSLVWLEYWKINNLNHNELRTIQKREAENLTFEKLLDFSFSNDILLLKDDNKLDEYRMKREVATDALNGLKQYYRADGVQHAQIDRVSSLLFEKEKLLLRVINTLSDFSRTDSLLQRRILVIISQTAQQSDVTVTTGNKRGDLFGLFRKTEEKSAYARQREKKKQPLASQITKELHSLQKEIHAQYTNSWNKLSAYSDSLQQRDKELNSQIKELIWEFEQTSIAQSGRETRQMIALSKQSFRIILFIAATAILLIVVFYIFIHRDIRKRLEYRMSLEISDRQNRELLAARRNLILTVSHDLCAPLSTINGYAELMPEEKDEVQRNRYAENILNASHHVIGLANNLLYYFRLEAGKEQPDKETFHPGRVLENVLHPFRIVADKKGLGLTVETEGVNIMVEGDRLRLTQILNNLLTNAVKFTPAGYVHVGVRYADGRLRFFVRDTGTGISEDRQKNLFKAFERLGADNSQPGFGLGLSITARLVSLLGGTISVESREGHGSTFEVCLPMLEAGRPETTSVQRVEYARLSGLKAVLIDDDRIQADMTRRMLARSGMVCDCCHDIKELTELLRSRRYDLLLTDMQMPETDGYTVLALLRNSNLGQSKDIPVLAVTARTDGEMEQLKRDGFARFLHKPFSMDELLSAVAECTGGRIPQRQGLDFTALLEGEDNQKEILDMFVQDMKKTMADLRKAIGTKDYAGIIALIHKGTPLWETICMDIPVPKLERLASLVPEAWDEAAVAEVWKLVAAVDEAVEKAKKLKEGME